MYEECLTKKYFEYEKRWDCNFLVECYGSEDEACKTFNEYFLNKPDKIIKSLLEDIKFIRHKSKKTKNDEKRLLEVFDLLVDIQKLILRDYEQKKNK